jgi:transaldolase / glucose-6-phosphate isomerase
MTTTTAIKNPLLGLQRLGQSVWLDYIRRGLIASGELRRLIDEDGLRGMTSNPAIFEKAIAGSDEYADMLQSLAATERDPKAVYERIAIRDVQDAADTLLPVYQQSKYRDGYVSLEVSPHLARDVDGTVQEARRLWSAVARPNVMIKVPGTPEGIVALRSLIAEGININVTLLFAQAAYERVADTYLAGLEDRAARGEDLAGVASVASFFVSRIDTAVDAAAANNPAAQTFAGKIAIANAKLAYAHYRALVASPRWSALAAKGAQTQRLLWASTSSKNPSYRDVVYVEELIGEDTVDTIPPATFDAFRDHGSVRPSLTEDLEGARETMAALARAGISIDTITDRLLDDGIELFAEAFDRLLEATGKQLGRANPATLNLQTDALPSDAAAEVQASLADWQKEQKVQRFWRGDASLWTSTDESKWLGWLGIVDDQIARLGRLTKLSAEVREEKFTHALLLGMGGSSLCPEVLQLTFGTIAGYPDLHVLDSTDPGQVRSIEQQIDLARTIFIVSSKSGGTLEPNIFKQYFYERVKEVVGEREAGRRFIAITDPGSHMQKVAERDGFREIFFGVPEIGGRYSALSAFGMVPAAIMGLDVARFLRTTQEMVRASGPSTQAAVNPGVVLGTILGVLAGRGRNKVTLITSPGIGDLGAWLEQLLAESTGKDGQGLIPIDGEPLAAPERYGADRVFAYLRLEAAPDREQDHTIEALERAGQPVVRIAVEEPYHLGQEFFRWEIATAVAGSIMKINPFNQPDVEASKIATKRLTEEFERTGALPAEEPILEVDGIKLFTDAANTAALRDGAGSARSLAGYLGAHVNRLTAGDYFALLGYIEMNEPHASSLRAMRSAVRDSKRVATCVGFGPRFLHSTGQAYKGGPNTGVFLQITCDDAVDVAVPGQKYTFGVVKAAQARGDFQVLSERGRRALRVHLGADVADGLKRLEAALRLALKQKA